MQLNQRVPQKILPALILFLILISTVVMSCGEKGVFRRLVDTIPDRAVTRVNSVNMRIAPFVLASKVDVLQKGIPLKIVDRSDKKDRIGRSVDYWYRVRLINGLEGWIYGTGLTLNESPGKGENPVWNIPSTSSVIPDGDLRGKWKVSSGGDSFKRVELLFRKDGTFLYQRGAEMPAEGTYKVDADLNSIQLKSGSLPDGTGIKYFFTGRELRLSGDIGGTRVVFRRSSMPGLKVKKSRKQLPDMGTMEGGEGGSDFTGGETPEDDSGLTPDMDVTESEAGAGENRGNQDSNPLQISPSDLSE